MPIRQTHTYARLEVSRAAYDEIAGKLREAGYDHAFIDRPGETPDPDIDMHGIGINVAQEEHQDDDQDRRSARQGGQGG